MVNSHLSFVKTRCQFGQCQPDTNTNAYCPRSFLRLYAWINTEKKNLANIQPSWPHAWSITIYVDPVIVQNTDWNIKDKLLSVPYTNTFVPRDKLSVALQRLHVWDSAKLRLEKKKNRTAGLLRCTQIVLTKICFTECGRRRRRLPRVLGGDEAIPHSWPWQAMIEAKKSRDEGWTHKCGASLIHPEWIVTAAHCLAFSPDPRIYRIILGLYMKTTTEHKNNPTAEKKK